MIWVIAAVSAVAAVASGLRWLRVAQREHYLPLEVSKFARRWTAASVWNRLLDVAAFAGAVGAIFFDERWAFVVAAAQIGPIGLSIRGTSAPLAWTDRLKRLAALTGAITFGAMLAGAFTNSVWPIVLALLFLPLTVDISLAALSPLERRLGNRWVERAAAKMRSSDVTVAAMTGSYGKTSTKNYLAHLIAGSKRVYASPASFNNRMGLARAVNEGLSADVDVFIAEMGTYGKGEIADICAWIPPKVAGMISIGPVHLERFKTLDAIVSAKSEILDRAEVGVICVDDERLARLAEVRTPTMHISTVSAQQGITVDGTWVSEVPEGVFGANLAVAIGMGKALGVELVEMVERIPGLPTTPHRQALTRSAAGFDIIDNTFNSNPAGARSSLRLLAGTGSGRKVVVTPGMVELGRSQFTENFEFSSAAAAVADDLLIVSRTNRAALLQGSANGRASVTVVDSRQEAVEWVREHLGPGDVVLYENDLPDHYP